QTSRPGSNAIWPPIRVFGAAVAVATSVHALPSHSQVSLGRPLGGKTGTTNDYKDAWFMGFSPDLVTGVYVGYDTPRPLANEAGGTVAAPIFRDFMGEALKDEPKVPFRIPEGVTLSPVDRTTGEPSYIGATNFILEAFRAGNEPQIGDLSSTIRIGSGGDTFFGGGYSDVGYDDIEDEATDQNDKMPDDESASEAPNSLEDILDQAESSLEETGETTPPKKTPSKAQTPEPPKEEAPEEDELDDGLY
ncbi:MAG: hypothetical protein ACPGVT_04520, partial [Maricaulaceae bacterium]